MAVHDKRLQEVLDKLCSELVEYFDSGFVVATFQDGTETKNAFLKFGNDYAIEGIVSNIHDILYGQEEDEDDDDDLDHSDEAPKGHGDAPDNSLPFSSADTGEPVKPKKARKKK